MDHVERPRGLARLPDFLALMRLNRPIGTWLLMWPTLWALWLAAEGLPTRQLLLIFIAGVYLMRAAGCVVNDYADRHLDGHVKRTKKRGRWLPGALRSAKPRRCSRSWSPPPSCWCVSPTV